MKRLRKFLIGLLCVAAVVALIVLLGSGAQDFRDKYQGTDLTAEVSGIGRSDTYEHYLLSHQDVPDASEAVEIDLASFTGDAEMTENGLYERDGGTVTFSFDIPKDAMYNIAIRYLTVDSRGVDMERALYIGGEVPFSGASTLRFSRLWQDAGEVKKDNQGNDIRPTQVELFAEQTAYCRDDMGYVDEPYRFYFAQGENTLSLEAINEPMLILGITLTPITSYRTYEAYTALCPEKDMSDDAEHFLVKVQGEDAVVRSSPSLYARYDHSSPATEPYSVTNTILNYIGGDPWNEPGQWIEWEFEVPEDGYYNISVKARQAYQRGALSCRTLYLDGEVPFEEVSGIRFSYNTAWEMHTLSNAQGTPFRFYLTQGTHRVRLEATLGEMGAVLESMEDSIFRLNQIYRKVLVLTGVNPDRFRDYNIEGIYPEVIEAMDLESKRLYKLVDDTVQITGQKSDRVAVAQTLAVQLEQFVTHTERITQSFTNFKDNITSLGTAMQNMAETKLDIDYIVISGEKAKLPEIHDGFIDKALHEIRACAASFFVDYNSLGNKYDSDGEDDVLEVWIVTGRDQSTILKTMVDDTFTPETGIPVNVKLVVPDSLLTAVVAGNGPDVVLSVDSWFPVNYAMRNAVEDLTQFEDFDDVVSVFMDSALTALEYGGGIYALPETQIFSVLFYREDVLEELGLEPPETWDELIAMLPTIQGNSMTVGIPFPDITTVDMSVFNSMIYQHGGKIYDDDAKHTLLDSEECVSAFELYTSLYNDYGLPNVYDFVSRFRSGEMPLGVAQYTTYNTLTVSAPEIRGLWDFTLFPGTLKTDENGTLVIDRSVHSQGACCMMIATDNQKIKDKAWEFMKWWVSTDSQTRFGREIESVLGASARYATANTEALDRLAWSASQLAVLKKQRESTVGFREIAGGYSTTRHMTNAIRRVINDKEDARETLLTYARTVNEEIKVKRQEFNLPID